MSQFGESEEKQGQDVRGGDRNTIVLVLIIKSPNCLSDRLFVNIMLIKFVVLNEEV